MAWSIIPYVIFMQDDCRKQTAISFPKNSRTGRSRQTPASGKRYHEAFYHRRVRAQNASQVTAISVANFQSTNSGCRNIVKLVINTAYRANELLSITVGQVRNLQVGHALDLKQCLRPRNTRWSRSIGRPLRQSGIICDRIAIS
jgi:hypothetical protein